MNGVMRGNCISGLWEGLRFHAVQLAIWLACWNVLSSVVAMEGSAVAHCANWMWICWMPCYALVFGVYSQWVRKADFVRLCYIPYFIYLIISSLILLLQLQATGAKINLIGVLLGLFAPLFGAICWLIRQKVRQFFQFVPGLVKVVGWFISCISLLILGDWLLVLYKLAIAVFLG